MIRLKRFEFFNESMKDSEGVEYSIRQVGDKYKIYVRTPAMSSPQDASLVFKDGSIWQKDYTSEEEAKEVIQDAIDMSQHSDRDEDFE